MNFNQSQDLDSEARNLKRQNWKRQILRVLLYLGDVILWTLVLAGFIWSAGAIWFLEFLPAWLSKPLAVIFLAFGIWLFRRGNRSNKNGFNWKRWARPIMASMVPITYFVTLFVQPSNERVWAEDQRLLPEIVIDGQQVTIKNFRDFRYRSADDPIPQYQDFTFSLDQVESAWFLIQRFTRFEGMAHTFVSFGIDTPQGKKYFSISVEIRREDQELYSPIRGIYRNYELMYVVGSEQDLIGVRTNVRENDRVFLYRANATPQQSRDLFLQFAKRIESLRIDPEFYGTFLNNCTNNIVAHTWQLTAEPINPLSPRIILPGYSASVAYELGLIGSPDQSFDDLQSASRIDQLAREAGISDAFSEAIRSR